MSELFKIVKDNKKSLREKSVDITLPLSDEIKELGLSMLEYLKLSQDEKFLESHKNVRPGVGLAAPQIGKNINLIAIYVEENEKHSTSLVLVNPKIILESAQKCFLRAGEGCLSVDKDHPGYIYRNYKIKVKAFNVLTNTEEVIQAKGFLAIVLQHEIDHLSGVLFYDRINKFDPFFRLPEAIEL